MSRLSSLTVRPLALYPLFALALLFTPGCSRDVIPNTDVEDTAQNRAVVDFLEKYRNAVESRDVGTLLTMADTAYYDDNGTPNGDDDIDLDGLREKLRQLSEMVPDVRYEIRYRRIRLEPRRILVDVTYTGSFRINDPTRGGDRWTRRLSDSRFVLVGDPAEGNLRFLSGM